MRRLALGRMALASARGFSDKKRFARSLSPSRSVSAALERNAAVARSAAVLAQDEQKWRSFGEVVTESQTCTHHTHHSKFSPHTQDRGQLTAPPSANRAPNSAYRVFPCKLCVCFPRRVYPSHLRPHGSAEAPGLGLASQIRPRCASRRRRRRRYVVRYSPCRKWRPLEFSLDIETVCVRRNPDGHYFFASLLPQLGASNLGATELCRTVAIVRIFSQPQAVSVPAICDRKAATNPTKTCIRYVNNGLCGPPAAGRERRSCRTLPAVVSLPTTPHRAWSDSRRCAICKCFGRKTLRFAWPGLCLHPIGPPETATSGGCSTVFMRRSDPLECWPSAGAGLVRIAGGPFSVIFIQIRQVQRHDRVERNVNMPAPGRWGSPFGRKRRFSPAIT